MANVTITRPNITEEERQKIYDRINEVLTEIAYTREIEP